MATLETRSPSESPHASTVTPSTLAFTPTMYPIATRSATSSRARVYAQSTLIRNPAASHGTRRRRPRGGDVVSVVAAARPDNRRPRTAPARRIAWPSVVCWWREEVVVAVLCEVHVVARRTGASAAEATAQGRDQRCAAMSGMVRRRGR
uniref:Predicted protein n=1 Tax=Hordeum vulgare subsp. vulgare TaxID=112509 RepID=F2D2I9_HORVV|nr:predicted protein [Hordeum vulgare subsp. vulgare]